MRKSFVVVVLACTVIACGLTNQQAKDVTNNVLSDVQIACVLGSALTDDATVAEICGISKDVIPILHHLIGQREALKRYGATACRPAQDGGADGSK